MTRLMPPRNREESMQRTALCIAFLKERCQGVTLDSHEAAGKMKEDWGVWVDWHDFSAAFESLRSAGVVRFEKVGFDMQYVYHVLPREMWGKDG